MSITRQNSLLHVEDMYKWYGDKLVLENVDLTVREGSVRWLVRAAATSQRSSEFWWAKRWPAGD
jgi:ABC-type transporter Mla maintaining outer membrane lipid asymmetry ATPase subunit MlaF